MNQAIPRSLRRIAVLCSCGISTLLPPTLEAAGPAIPAKYEDFIDLADAIVVAEITAIDAREAAYDGPSWLTARIRRNLDGTLPDGEPVIFSEGSLGQGPRCQPGQLRILFLIEDTRPTPRPSRSIWSMIAPVPRRGQAPVLTAFFIDETQIPIIDLKSLRAFLRGIDASGLHPKRAEFAPADS